MALSPDFKPGQNVLDALTAARLNAMIRAINANKPLASESVLVSYTGAGAVISTRTGSSGPHPFKIMVSAQPDTEEWQLSVYPGVVHNTSHKNKRRFAFKMVEPEEGKGWESVELASSDIYELYIQLKFEKEPDGPVMAFEEHLTGVAGEHCVRGLLEVAFYWHKVKAADKEKPEGTTKKDKPNERYYYIGRVTFDGNGGYTVDQRRKSDIDICDPCDDPGSSSSSSSSSSSGSGDEDGVYVVTDVSCSMEALAGGECCVTLTMTKRKMADQVFVFPEVTKTDVVNCCGEDD